MSIVNLEVGGSNHAQIMQEIDAWRIQLRYLTRHYDDGAIAAMCGATRQAVNKWHSAVRGPQDRHKKGLEKAYKLAKEQRSRLVELEEIARNMIMEFKSEWKGKNSLEFELDSWPEHFMKARLPWLISDDFYHDGFNRRGEFLEPFAVPNFNGCGWSNPESQKAFIRDYAL